MPKSYICAVLFAVLVCFSTANSQAIVTNCANTSIPPAECECLIDFYIATNGNSWSDSQDNNWTENDDPATWAGVFVFDGHVIGIERSGKNLEGQIPDLSRLAMLEILDLSENRLGGTIPDASGLTNLNFLDLGFNRLTGTIPEFLPTDLAHLLLDGNMIEGEIPPMLATAGFVSLSLSYNKLAYSIDFLPGMTSDWQSTQTVPPANVTAEAANAPGTVYVRWEPILYTGDGGYYRVLRADKPEGPYAFIGEPTADKFADGIEIAGMPPGLSFIVVESFTPAHGTPIGYQQNDLFSGPGEVTAIYVPNYPPVITGQKSLETPEETELPISLEDLVVEDPDHRFPTGFSMTVFEGDNYSVSNNTVMPDTDFNGMLSVTAMVSDGMDASEPFILSVVVTPVNDRPAITGHVPLAVREETGLEITAGDLEIHDPDNNFPDDFAVSILDGDNFSYSNGIVYPANDFNGELQIPVTVSDGTAGSDVFPVVATVTPVNDIPLISGSNYMEIPEDSSFEITLNDLEIFDPDNIFPDDFSLTVHDGDNYTHSGNTVVPADNFNGLLAVSAAVHDGMSESPPFPLEITVTPVNDAPRFAGSPVLDAMQTVLYDHEIKSHDPDTDDTLAITASVLPSWLSLKDNGNGTAHLSGKPTNVDVGEHTVELSVSDSQAATDTVNFTIDVAHVNDTPIIVGQRPLATSEDTPIDLSLDDLIVSEPDNTYPAGYSLSAMDGMKYTRFGNTIIPNPNFADRLIVPVFVNDGTVDSNVCNLKISVTPQNDAPGFVSEPVRGAVKNTEYKYDVTAFDPDSDETLSVTASMMPRWMELTDHGGGKATLSGMPEDEDVKDHRVVLIVRDSVGVENSQSFFVSVSEVGDTPVITGQKYISTPEDTPLEIILEDLEATSPNNGFPSGFTLSIKSGTGYSVDGNIVIPAEDFAGELTVPVSVIHDNRESSVYNLSVEVVAVNDTPIFASVPSANASKDAMYRYEIATYDADRDDTIAITGVIVPAWLAFRDGGDGTAILEGTSGDAGTYPVTLQAADSEGETDVQSFEITVVDTNDAPAIVGQQVVKTLAGTPIAVSLGHLIVNDPDNDYPEGFVLTVMDGEGYTRSGNVIVSDAGFVGELSVGVRVNDGSADSNSFELIVVVEEGASENMPPDTPYAVSWQPGTVFPAGGSVTLVASPFSDPENDKHVSTHWMIRKANGKNRCPDSDADSDHVVTVEYPSGNGHSVSGTKKSSGLTEYTAENLAPGLEYVWQVGYTDSGSGLMSWSPRYSFRLGDFETETVSIDPGNLASDYAIVSFTGFKAAEDVFEESFGGLYDRSIARIFGYDPEAGGYVEYGESDGLEKWGEPGAAYWILAKDGIEIPTRAIPISLGHDFEISLKHTEENGWNLIGCPNGSNYYWREIEVVAYGEDCNIVFGPKPVSELGPGDPLDTGLWRWEDGVYQSETEIMEKGKGYWVKAKGPNVALRFGVPAQAGNETNRRGSQGAKRDGDGPPPAPGTSFESGIDSGGGGCFIGISTR